MVVCALAAAISPMNCVLERTVLTLILSAYFNATLGGVFVLFALQAIDELRNA
jgi:hypothetical protein